MFARVMAVALAMVSMVGAQSRPVSAPMRADALVVAQGKSATALVEVKEGGGTKFATAFCIHPAGVFVTNFHVTGALPRGQQLTLILDPGERTQKAIRASVLRENREEDLSILVADDAGNYPFLPLGSAAGVQETDPVTAFGYPFGTMLARNGSYPSISVNAGRVTSLRKTNGVLDKVQLDASLNPGNSGGPVLDEKGAVVGIVSSGLRGTGINFAIPVDKLRALIEKPHVTAPVAEAVEGEAMRRAFKIHVVSFKPNTDYQVELGITLGDAARRYPAQKQADGSYLVKALPVAAPTSAPSEVTLNVKFGSARIECKVADRAITVGGTSIRLTQLRTMEKTLDGVKVITAEGATLRGALGDASNLEADLGGAPLRLDLTKAAEATVTTPDAAAPADLRYRVVVKEGGTVVAEGEGTLVIDWQRAQVASAKPATVPVDDRSDLAAIKPAPLNREKVTLKLPAPAQDIVVGGGGRFLIMHLAKLRKLAVFDVNEGRIVKYLNMAGDNVAMAAGARKLLVLLPDQNVLQRWSLVSMERELTVAAPENAKIITLGHSSEGPALINASQFVNLNTMRTADVQFDRGGGAIGTEAVNVRASADGTVFGAWRLHVSPQGLYCMAVNGNSAQVRYEHITVGYVIPSHDGSILFTGNGLYTPDLKPVAPEQFRNSTVLPTNDPGLFIALRYGTRDRRLPNGGEQRKVDLSVYTMSDRRLLVTVPDLDELAEPQSGFGGFARGEGLSVDKQVHLVPLANLLVTVPRTGEEMVLRKFDVVDLLDKAGIDYLYVSSMPVRQATAGKDYAYQIGTKSKRGGVKYRLDSGPDGMTISPTGKITWRVPAVISEDRTAVIVTITDSTGQELFHSYSIAIGK